MKKILLTVCVLLAVSAMLTSCSFLTVKKQELAPVDAQAEPIENSADESEKETFAELIKSYEGSYSNGVSWHFGGDFVNIAVNGNELEIYYTCLGSAPNSRVADVTLSMDINDIDSNVISGDFEDGWGNTGKICFTFENSENKEITVNISDVVTAPSAMWGVCPGESHLFPDSFVSDKIDYSYEDYEMWAENGFPEYSFDSKTKSFFYSLPEKPKNLIEDMSAAERRAINIFLSNFSEISFYGYGNGDANENEELLFFAFKHNDYNSTGKVFMTNSGYYAMTGEDVDTTLNRYFGRTVPRISIGHYIYSDGNFHIEPAAGSVCSFFSVATSLIDNNDGTYSVEFDIFDDIDAPTPINSASYSLTPEEASYSYSYSHSGSAIVSKKTYNGSETYELKQYSLSYN